MIWYSDVLSDFLPKLPADHGVAGCLLRHPWPHQKLFLGWGHSTCSNSSSTWSRLCPTAAGLAWAGPPEEACPHFTCFTWLSAAFLSQGIKSCQRQSAPPQLYSQYLAPCLWTWSRWCFHNPAHALTLEEWGSFSAPYLALWSHSSLRSIVALLPDGFSGVSGWVQCHGQHCLFPHGRVM